MTSIDPEATPQTDPQDPSSRHGAFKLGGVHCRGCADAVERALRAQPHVGYVRLDWKNDLVHVGYDPTRIGPEDIEGAITRTGCDCEPTDVGEGHHHEAMAPPERRMQHLEHGVDAQPI
jgi:copper chaperone CopZ